MNYAFFLLEPEGNVTDGFKIKRVVIRITDQYIKELETYSGEWFAYSIRDMLDKYSNITCIFPTSFRDQCAFIFSWELENPHWSYQIVDMNTLVLMYGDLHKMTPKEAWTKVMKCEDVTGDLEKDVVLFSDAFYYLKCLYLKIETQISFCEGLVNSLEKGKEVMDKALSELKI